MKIHPAIAALRDDRVAQRRLQERMQTAVSRWRATQAARQIANDIQDFGNGASLNDCSALAKLLGSRTLAMGFVDELVSPVIQRLVDDPLCKVPFAYRTAKGFATIELMKAGRSVLRLSVYEPLVALDAAEPATATFVDRESVELVLSGTLHGRVHRVMACSDGATIETTNHDWRAGQCITLSDSSITRQILHVPTSAVLLQLTRTPVRSAETREHRLADGSLIKSASGEKLLSQKQMALAVLGKLASSKSAGPIELCALDASEDREVRWEAVRQLLALDTAMGLNVLDKLRGDRDALIRQSALDLRQTIMRTYRLREDA